MPINLYYEDIDDLDTQHYGEDYNEYHEKSEALVTAAEALVEPTSCEITRCSQQKVPATIVNAVGWLDDIEGRPSTKVPKRINFSQDKFASEQKQLLTDKRQSILDKREAQADQNEKSKNYNPGNKEASEVKVVGYRYFLSKHFKASNTEAQKLISDTAVKLSPNEAQKCGFRIVANHGVEYNGEQLKMYLGGMTGTGKSWVIKAPSYFFAKWKKSY